MTEGKGWKSRQHRRFNRETASQKPARRKAQSQMSGIDSGRDASPDTFVKTRRRRHSGWSCLLHLIGGTLSDMVTLFLFFWMIACLWMVYQEQKTGEMQFVFGLKPVCIVSGSMEPGIRTGAVVVVKETPVDSLAMGDIILFRSGESYVTHRLVGEDEEAKESGADAWLITKGDANRTEDTARLSPDQIRGKVIWVCNAASRLMLIRNGSNR